MERETRYITLTAAARLYEVSQVRIWQLVRQKKLLCSTNGMRSATVDAAQLEAYMREHLHELEVWQKPVRQAQSKETSNH